MSRLAKVHDSRRADDSIARIRRAAGFRRGDFQRAQQHWRVPRNDRANDAERLTPRIAEDVLAEWYRFAFEFAAKTTEIAENVGRQRRFRPRLGADCVAGFWSDR